MADDVQWVKIDSWHIYAVRLGEARTVCGLAVPGISAPPVDKRPGKAKSCENCLRIAGPK